MKNKKTVLILILTAAITVNAYSQQYDDESDFEVRLDWNSVAITGYLGSKQKVRIPPRIQNLPVTIIEAAAFAKCESLTSITIPNSVTSIGVAAFAECTSLTGITIPDSVTTIANSFFYQCTSLTSITIGNRVTRIGNEAFTYCKSLTSITIPSSVITIGDYAFAGCNSLTNINIPSSVTSIGYLAFFSTNLTSITVDSRNPAYTSVDGVLFDKNIRTIIRYPVAMKGTNYVIPSSVTSIGDYAFVGCNSLTNITIPSSVTSIGEGAFYFCNSLTNINIPSSVTSIGDSAFRDCNSLTSINIPSSVTSIGHCAFWCENLTRVTLSRRTHFFNSSFNVFGGGSSFPESARITYRD
jgi:serine acetyltransferase